MKKLLMILLVIISLLYIYIFTYDKKIYYFSISNNKNNVNENKIAKFLEDSNILQEYIYKFNNHEHRINDFNNMLNNNEIKRINNKDISFKNALVKADVITISFTPDLNYFNNIYKSISYRDDLIEFMDNIREYSKEDIFYVGINENIQNKYIKLNIKKINQEMEEYCTMQNIIYIDFTNNYHDSIIKQIKTTTLSKKNASKY